MKDFSPAADQEPNAAPWSPNAIVAPQKRPQVPARPPALFTVHPDRWTVLHGHVVPQTGSLKYMPGINEAVKRDGEQEVDIAAAANAKIRQGWQVLPHDIDGPGTSYLTNPAPGVFLTRWERCFAGSTQISSDSKGYAEWLRGLVKDGKIKAPRLHVLHALHSRVKDQLEAAETELGQGKTGMAGLVRRLRDDVAAIEDEIERVGQGSALPAAPAALELGKAAAEQGSGQLMADEHDHSSRRSTEATIYNDLRSAGFDRSVAREAARDGSQEAHRVLDQRSSDRVSERAQRGR